MHKRHLLLGFTAALVAAAPRAQEVGLERVFPADSFAFAGFAGLRECRAAAGELGLVDLARSTLDKLDPELVEQYVGRRLRRALPRLHEHLQRLGLEPAALRAVLQGGCAVGVGRPTLFGGGVVPSLVVALDVHDCEAQARGLVDSAQRLLIQHEPDVKVEQEAMADTEVTELRRAGHSGAVVYASTRSLLLLGNSPGYLRECLAVLRGERPSLTDHPAYRRARQQQTGRVLGGLYVSVEALEGALGPFVPYEVQSMLQALGAAGMDCLYLGAAVTDNGSADVAHVGVKGPASGLLRTVLGSPATADAVALCPDDTGVLICAGLQGDAILDAGRRLLAAVPPELHRELHRGLARELPRHLARAGVSHEDLVQAVSLLGPGATLAVTMPMGHRLMPELLAVVDVRDAAAAEQVLARLWASAPDEAVGEASYEGTSIHFLRTLRRAGAPFDPAWALSDRRLLVGSTVQTVKAALARAAGKRPGLAADPAVAARLRTVDGASVFALVRLQAAVTRVWDLALPVLEAAAADEPRLDLNALPTVEQLRGVVRDTVLWLRADGDGLTCRQRQSLGAGSALAVAGLLAELALAPLPDDQAAGPGDREPGGAAGKRPKRRIF